MLRYSGLLILVLIIAACSSDASTPAAPATVTPPSSTATPLPPTPTMVPPTATTAPLRAQPSPAQQSVVPQPNVPQPIQPTAERPHIVSLFAGEIAARRGETIIVSWEVAGVASARLTANDGSIADNQPLKGTLTFTIPPTFADITYVVRVQGVDRNGDLINLSEYDQVIVAVTDNALVEAGLVSLSPSIGTDGVAILVAADSAITFSWAEAPRQAYGVEFFVQNGATGEELSIGLDNNLADGASVTWTVPANFSGAVHAFATMPDVPNYRTAGVRSFRSQ